MINARQIKGDASCASLDSFAYVCVRCRIYKVIRENKPVASLLQLKDKTLCFIDEIFVSTICWWINAVVDAE